MRTKRLSLLGFSICLILVFSSPSLITVYGADSGWKWPKSISILTPSVEQAQYSMSVGFATVMEKDTGMKISVVAINEDTQRYKMLRNNEVFGHLMGTVATANCMKAESGFATRDGGPLHVRVIWPSGYYASALIVRGDSKIKTWKDIKPGMKRPSIPAIGGIEAGLLLFCSTWTGIDDKEFVKVPVGNPPAVMDTVVTGKADMTVAPPNMAFVHEAAAGPYGLRFLELNPEKDPEAAARFLAKSPTYGFAKNVLGPKASLGIVMPVSYNDLETTVDADPELVYHVAKWLGEKYDLYKDQHEMFSMWGIDQWRAFLDSSYIPMHEGTIRYLKEIGIWTEKDDKVQKENIEIIDIWTKAYQDAIAAADAKGIKVDPINKEWMALWAERSAKLPPFSSPAYR
ncbi:MAG: hypothetical protein JW882_12570 [Deltaproteobacteria bacterium]|nr:hypothetical protein [Deltaproteobacteria bacterium]